jgi:hypothetical protein
MAKRTRYFAFVEKRVYSRDSGTLPGAGNPGRSLWNVPPPPARRSFYMAGFSEIYRKHPQLAGSLAVALLVCVSVIAAQDPGPPASDGMTPSPLFRKVIGNQEHSEKELDQFERIHREEIHGEGSDPKPPEAKTWRVFPTGTGVSKIAVSPDGKPITMETYRSELEKLEKYLSWIVEDGPGQKEAYAKAERKRKERFDLLEATNQAFFFTPDGEEIRAGRVLSRYTITPNPNYRPTTRNTTIFTRVRGTIWIDKETSQMAKIDGSVTEDISIALFLAKVYKGSHFMQERYEVSPGVWQPTFEQYDFDGRKFLRPFSIHERSFYSDYKRVGLPKESVGVVRAELNKIGGAASAH